MSRWPLRWRIAAWSAASTGAILIVFGMATAATLYIKQVQSVDAELVRDFRLLRPQASTDLPLAATRLAAAYRPWLQVAVADRDGFLAGGMGRLAEDAVRARDADAAWSYRWDNWTFWRIHRERIGAYRVTLARSLDMKPDIGDEFAAAYLLSLPAALLLAGIAAWWLGRKALRPIRDLADAARAVTADQLGTRLPVPEAQDEMAGLARVLNAMLERLERSFHQTRRFAADASHELRTPLTIMRGEIEATLREGGLSPAQEKRVVSLLEETARLDRISESLLLLAEFDSGADVLQREPVDLARLMAEAAEDAELLGVAKHLRFDLEVAPRAVVQGDPIQLRRLLLNLLDNAVKFNVEGGRIRCRLESGADGATLTIGNTGPGIAPARRAFLFERFSRLGGAGDAARGHGLGLSLCREIAAAHRGSLTLSGASGPDWTEFVVRIPAGPKPD